MRHELSTIAAPAVVTTTAAEDVAVHLSAIEIDVSSTTHSDGGLGLFVTTGILLRAATDRAYLTASEHIATQVTAIHIYIGGIDITVGNVSATEGTACSHDGVCCRSVALTRVVNLLFVALVYIGGRGIVGTAGFIAIAHITIVDGQVR